jgi:hypothetical protein
MERRISIWSMAAYFLASVRLPGSHSSYAVRIEAFQQSLRDLGYVEGNNINIEYRYPKESLIGFRTLRPK